MGFRLSDKLKISYYDAEIFEAVLKRLDAEKDSFHDTAGYASEVKDEMCIRDRGGARTIALETGEIDMSISVDATDVQNVKANKMCIRDRFT